MAVGVSRGARRCSPVEVEMKTTPSNAVNSSSVPRLALSRREAAAALGVHPGTIDVLVKRGQIRPSRATSHPLFPVSEIERFLRETSLKPAA